MKLVACPHCGTPTSTHVHLQNGMVGVMCWDVCGMDFEVNGIWFMLNSWETEDIDYDQGEEA